MSSDVSFCKLGRHKPQNLRGNNGFSFEFDPTQISPISWSNLSLALWFSSFFSFSSSLSDENCFVIFAGNSCLFRQRYASLIVLRDKKSLQFIYSELYLSRRTRPIFLKLSFTEWRSKEISQKAVIIFDPSLLVKIETCPSTKASSFLSKTELSSLRLLEHRHQSWTTVKLTVPMKVP